MISEFGMAISDFGLEKSSFLLQPKTPIMVNAIIINEMR